MAKQISSGTIHKLPKDLREALNSAPAKALEAWEDITPLARNEWICWVEYPKTKETREKHVERTVTELMEGMRRPCCWSGCIHRKDKPMSKSQKFVHERNSKKAKKS